jgi:hypothetical protein
MQIHDPLAFPEAARQPRQHLRRDRCTGLAAAAPAALRDGALQDRQGSHRLPVEVERHRYSVPHSLVGQALEARVTAAVVELMHRCQRIASHARTSRQGGFTTVAAHMPSAHCDPRPHHAAQPPPS